jgi:hypothetical protein
LTSQKAESGKLKIFEYVFQASCQYALLRNSVSLSKSAVSRRFVALSAEMFYRMSNPEARAMTPSSEPYLWAIAECYRDFGFDDLTPLLKPQHEAKKFDRLTFCHAYVISAGDPARHENGPSYTDLNALS